MKFDIPNKLVADEFILRGFEIADTKSLTSALNASLNHLRPYMSFANIECQTDEKSKEFIVISNEKADSRVDFTFGIFSVDNTTVLGSCGFHLRNRAIESRYAELGMWIHGKQSGKGLGTKVLLGLKEWAYNEWPWLRLEWRCDANNIASRRTAEKAGLIFEGILRCNLQDHFGVWRDTAVYSEIKYDPKDAIGPFKVALLGPADSVPAKRIFTDTVLDTYLGIMADDSLSEMIASNTFEGWAMRIQEKSTEMRHLGIFSSSQKLLGLCSFGKARDQDIGISSEVYMINIPRIYQRNRLGSTLFMAVRKQIAEAGFENFYLWCGQENKRARHFYDKHGAIILDKVRSDRGFVELLMKFEI